MTEMIMRLLQTDALTCAQIGVKMRIKPGEIIGTLRNLVDTGLLTERNGFYSRNGDATPSPLRRTYPWVEGVALPDWVLQLATGARSVETVTVLAELDSVLQQQGYPQFALAFIDAPMKMFVLYATHELIGNHVLRYMPVDVSAVTEGA